MKIDPQRLGYKLNSIDKNYSRKLEQNLANSKSSFSGIQTPGWSSMIKSELSERNKSNQHSNNYQGSLKEEILKKLRKNDELVWKQTDQSKLLSHQSFENQENKGRKVLINKQKQSRQNKENSKPKQKRFQAISVHEHLYQDGIKQQNKKMLRKIVDNEIKKKEVFPFRPTISERSHQLAQLRYSRAQSHSNLIYDQKHETYQEETKPSEQIQKETKEMKKYRMLNELFYTLSEGESLITEKTINNTFQQIPLPCIKSLEPLMEKIFKGQLIEWVDFIEYFNNKIKNQQSFLKILGNWMMRRVKKNELT